MLSDHGLAKSTWTEADFDLMGWHDARLYCFTVFPETFELLLDLDYITKWVDPVAPEEYFSFWVSPVTLVFRDIQNLSATVDMRELCELEVLTLKRSGLPGAHAGWRWTLELSSGELSVDASGYTQYFRRAPTLQPQQSLNFEGRGGISYARTTFDLRVPPH
jgi:hypothetical protein